jgi:hypothetical protein
VVAVLVIKLPRKVRIGRIVSSLVAERGLGAADRECSPKEGRVAVTIEDIETWLGHPLPEPYRSFLAGTAENFLAANDRTLVYGRASIVERNETFEAQTYCPGHLAIGDDSGGSALVLSLADGSVHSVGMGAMTPDCFEPVAPSFAAWADAGFPHADV